RESARPADRRDRARLPLSSLVFLLPHHFAAVLPRRPDPWRQGYRRGTNDSLMMTDTPYRVNVRPAIDSRTPVCDTVHPDTPLSESIDVPPSSYESDTTRRIEVAASSQQNPGRLSGQVALVTGAGSGMGRAIA